MGAITTGCTITDQIPALGRKIVMVETAATADTGDTIEITLSDYGISTLLGINGMIHSTENSIIIAEAPTTAVSEGVLTITLGGSGASDQKRVYLVYGK